MSIPLIGGLSIALFSVLFVLQLRAFTGTQVYSRTLLLSVALAALVTQVIAVEEVLLASGGIDLGLVAMLALIAALTSIVLILAATRLPIDNLFLIVSPMAVITLVPACFANVTAQPRFDIDAGLASHIFLSVAAYCVLTLSACQSAALWRQERLIRQKRSIALIRFLPPLVTMERLLFAMVGIGFGVLTLAIASGFLFLDDLFDQRVVHHTALTSLAWLIYGALLIGRIKLGWRSTTAVTWSLVGFSVLVLGYVGSKFVIEVLLNTPS